MKKIIKRRGVTEKYLNFLNALKSELTNNSIKEPHYFMIKHNVSNHWVSFLLKNNIIYRDENYNYKWNDKIPPSIKIVEAFRNNVKEKQIRYKERLKMEYMRPELEFNISNIETPKRRKTWEKIGMAEKWLNNLFFIKNELDNTEYYKLIDLKTPLRNWKAWQAFLVRNNIIYKKDTGRYVWNDEIQISYKIIEKFRKEQQINNNRQRKQNIQQLETQPELQFDMNYIEIPAEIKAKAKTRTKSYKDKMKEKVNNAKQLNTPTQQNEYGVIRKFLKWLW